MWTDSFEGSDRPQGYFVTWRGLVWCLVDCWRRDCPGWNLAPHASIDKGTGGDSSSGKTRLICFVSSSAIHWGLRESWTEKHKADRGISADCHNAPKVLHRHVLSPL
jgi:hypothetical protein